MRHSFLRLYDGYGKVLLAFAVLAGFCTFAIMWVIDVNALTRKLFNAPLPAALEISQALLVGSIMLPFGFALARREHVNTVFLTSHFSAAARRRLYVFWMIAGFLLFAAVTYGTFHYGLRSFRMNEQIWGATIQFPVWPAKMAVSLGTLLICIQFLLDALHALLIHDGSHELPADPTEGHGHV